MDFGYQLGKDIAAIQEALARIESRLTALERKQPCRCGGDRGSAVVDLGGPVATSGPDSPPSSTATVKNYLIQPSAGLVSSPDGSKYALMAFTLGGVFHDPPDQNLWNLVFSEGQRLGASNLSIQPEKQVDVPIDARVLIGWYNVTTNYASFVLYSTGLRDSNGHCCCSQTVYPDGSLPWGGNNGICGSFVHGRWLNGTNIVNVDYWDDDTPSGIGIVFHAPSTKSGNNDNGSWTCDRPFPCS
ncbi:MAG: hypothetical protein ACLQU5_34575 [Isosphaeraceae bacterium]